VHVKRAVHSSAEERETKTASSALFDRLTSIVCVPKRSGKPSAEAQDLIREHP
jgi:hypothetical protein